MGKNYIESSLKRFLKRKVKITLGLVVTFLITGAVAFAEINIPENKNENWLEGIGTEKALGDTVLNINDNGKTAVEISNNTIIIKKDGKDNVEINLKNLSNIVYNNVKTSLELGKNALNSGIVGNTYVVSGSLPENYNAGLNYKNNVGESIKADGSEKYSVIEAGTTSTKTVDLEKEWDKDYVAGQYAIRNGIVINKGIIDVKKSEGKKDVFGQQTDDGGIAINYGIIKNDGIAAQRGGKVYNYGVLVNSGGNAQMGYYSYNYGIIANNGNRAQSAGGESKNYGILMNFGDEAQYMGADSKGYNYGLIANNSKGQYMLNGGIGYNYGMINVNSNGQFAQSDNKTSIAENYGIINVKDTIGQEAQKNSEVYNYGIIYSKKIAQDISINSSAYNYGVLYNHEGNIMHAVENSKENHNYGILITQGDKPLNGITKDNIINNGIILKREGANLSIFDDKNFKVEEHKNAEEYISGKIESNKNVFINNLGADKKTTVTEIADNLENAHITTAVTNDVGTVIKKDGDLTLNNSTIIGYFEKRWNSFRSKRRFNSFWKFSY